MHETKCRHLNFILPRHLPHAKCELPYRMLAIGVPNCFSNAHCLSPAKRLIGLRNWHCWTILRSSRAFYRAANTIFGNVARAACEEVVTAN